MKKFRLKIAPDSNLYVDVFILPDQKSLTAFARKRCGDPEMPAYPAVVNRQFKGNMVAELFFNEKHMSTLTVDHELFHATMALARRNHALKEVHIIDYTLNVETNREEELCSTFEYLKAQIMKCLGHAPKSVVQFARQDYIGARKYYKWDERPSVHTEELRNPKVKPILCVKDD